MKYTSQGPESPRLGRSPPIVSHPPITARWRVSTRLEGNAIDPTPKPNPMTAGKRARTIPAKRPTQ